MMKQLMIFLCACCLFLIGSMVSAAGLVEGPRSCQICGMDRQAYAHSRVLLTYDDSSTVGLCSIHCAAADMKQHADRQITSFKVADYNTHELIEGQEAFWVMGGQKQGVMTSQPKWAFARKEDARNFMAENGGELVSFD